MSRSDITVDVLIVGAGPGGAMAALYAAKKRPDLRVGLVEMRADMLRPQVLATLDDMTEPLRDVGIDPLDLGHIPQLKELERVQRREIQRIADKPDSALQTFIPFKVVAIDAPSRRATLQHSDDASHEIVIAFRHLLCADGAKRRCWQMLNKPEALTHRSAPAQPRYQQAGIVTLQCRHKALWRAPSIVHDRPLHLLQRHLQQLATLPDPDTGAPIRAWSKPYLPKGMAIRHGSSSDKLNIGCELPTCILTEADPRRQRALLISWGQRIANLMYAKEVELDVPGLPRLGITYQAEDFVELAASVKHDAEKKRMLRGAIIDMHRQVARQASFALPGHEAGDASVIGLGDVLQTPFFPLASGANNAMQTACLAIDVITPSGSFDAKVFQAAVDAIHQDEERSVQRMVAADEKLRWQQTCHYVQKVLPGLDGARAKLKAKHATAFFDMIADIESMAGFSVLGMQPAEQELLQTCKAKLQDMLFNIRLAKQYLKLYRSAVLFLQAALSHVGEAKTSPYMKFLVRLKNRMHRHYLQCSQEMDVLEEKMPDRKLDTDEVKSAPEGKLEAAKVTDRVALHSPALDVKSREKAVTLPNRLPKTVGKKPCLMPKPKTVAKPSGAPSPSDDPSPSDGQTPSDYSLAVEGRSSKCKPGCTLL